MKRTLSALAIMAITVISQSSALAAGVPIGAKFDRIQIVKGWLDAGGNLQEEVDVVVWSGDRQAGADGKVLLVGNTIDIENATLKNMIGTPELITAWTDPAFGVTQNAFYCARVIEIPTPRWSVYDAKRFGMELLGGAATTVTGRAYTSPLWYLPAS